VQNRARPNFSPLYSLRRADLIDSAWNGNYPKGQDCENSHRKLSDNPVLGSLAAAQGFALAQYRLGVSPYFNKEQTTDKAEFDVASALIKAKDKALLALQRVVEIGA